MAEHYDLIVLGGGSGGVRAARLAANAGMSVAIIEASRWGGTCVNLGCVPKKIMKYAADFAADFDDARDYGWRIDAPDFDWSTFVDRRDAEVRRLNGVYAAALKRAGATLVEGRGKITGAHQVQVQGRQMEAERILIATGGTPFVPEFAGADLAMQSDQVFALRDQPDRLLVAGGGFIALEFASIFHALGTRVTLVHRGDLFLRGFDADVRQMMAQALRDKGIELRFNTEIARIESAHPPQRLVHFNDGTRLEVDQVLLATGRSPNVEHLWVPELDIHTSAEGAIQVNGSFRTSVDSIYAIGDVVGRMALTPVAIAEAKALVHHWLEDQPVSLNYETIPYAVFSSPTLASVGLSEEEALRRSKRLLIYETRFRALKLSLTNRQEMTYMKMLVEEGTERVLGLHLVGADVAEILQGAAVAINMGATKADFDRTVGIHPTEAEELVTLSRPPRSVIP